jgi:DNA mismatch repair protein MSH2
VAATFLPVMEMASGLVAELDVLVSLAHVAAYAPSEYVRPKVSQGGDVCVERARHPCLELQPDVAFVPNDHRMLRDSSRVQVGWWSVLSSPGRGRS